MQASDQSLAALQKALGYTFRDEAGLRLALTHPSTKLDDNQRLEFLGDAALELCVSDMLYHKYPDLHEGELSARRATLVCERTLAVVARSLELGACLMMGRGEEQTGGREKPSILSDAAEAVLAAVYLDGGLEAARGVVARLFADDERLIAWRGTDIKSALQQYTQAHGLGLPAYEVVEESGPDHDKRFAVRALVQGAEVARGAGRSKQEAEKAAARAALRGYAADEEDADAPDKA